MADSRFFPWFKLELEPTPGVAGAAALASALASVVPIDRNFYEADVKVTMRYALVGNRFQVTIAGLTGPVYDAIEVKKTSVKLSLGYYGGLDQQVLEGTVQKKEAKAGECFYETTLSGVETAYYLLQNKCLGEGDVPSAEDTDIMTILQAISRQAGVEPPHTAGTVPGPRTQFPRRWSFEHKSALDALKQVHYRLRRIGGYSLSLRDGKIWYGRAVGPLNNAGEEITTTVYSYDNYLVETKPVHEDRGGRRSRCPQEDGNATPLGYDFEMLGDPRLRPGDTVSFKVKVNGREQVQRLTVESITHDFSRTKGYRCTGRALQADQFLEHAFRAMAPGAEAVGEEVTNMLARNQERFPAVNVGDVTDYSAGEHLANARLGLEFEPTVTSPSVQVRLGAEGFTLERRPMVSPFAWNHCGLVVPVYSGMRAVAVHNRYLREDALLDGFLWTEEMTPPPNQAGDYWLCLPLNVPASRAPNTSDKAANDLTTGGGKRVIQLKGLRITIGDGLLPNLGTRPSNVGADDELQIEHSSGARITMKANEIKLQAGGRTLTLASGKVSVT